jgi:hypothetical protein
MKYFTKEWYKDTILAEMCFQLKHTSNAEKFSEKYFNSLYKAQKKWFIKNEKHTARFTKTAFDLAAAEAAFEANFNENLEFVKANIPAEILEKVADVRILAMGSASYDVTHAITRFCGQVNRRCEKVKEDYDAEVEKLAENIGWYKINSLNMLANAPIALAEGGADGNFILETSPEYTEIACKVTLISPEITERDENLVGAQILHFEILPEGDGKIALNLLCRTADEAFLSFSATAKDIEVEEIN